MVLNVFKAFAVKNEAANHRHSNRSANRSCEGVTPAGMALTRREIPLPEVTLARVTPLSSAVTSHSASAPTSPALRSSIPRNVGPRRPPAAYICVEKGRIEFARPESTERPDRLEDKAEEDKAKPALMMGSKIFRPHQLRKPEALPVKTNTEDCTEKHLPLKPNSLTQAHRPRELPSKPLASTRKNHSLNRSFEKSPQPVTAEVQPVMSQSSSAALPAKDHQPKPSRIAKISSNSQGSREALLRKSRESSPAAKQEPPRPRVSLTASHPSTKESHKESAKSSRGIPVPVSPNLVRWRAKLSKGSVPSPTCNRNEKTSEESNCSESSGDKTVNKEVTDKHVIQEPIVANNGSSTTKDSAPESSLQSSLEECEQQKGVSVDDSNPNQVQLSNLHFEVKRLEETVKSLLPLRNQQSALVQSYEERLTEAQGRIASLESENQLLRTRLAKQETEGFQENKTLEKFRAENSSLSSQLEQQRIQFDKCMDDIANHVVQALISQRNLQAECRRLRSQVSDLEQQNVTLNFLLTQSLRGSAGSAKESTFEMSQNPIVESIVQKSTSCDANISSAAACRDSVCTVASDSELRLAKSSSMLDTTNRPIVSKDSNWSLTVSQDRSPAYQSHCPGARSPVDRAEKLLAVLKHRLFTAQLPSHRSRRSEYRRSLPASALGEALTLPSRPNTLTLTSSDESQVQQSPPVLEGGKENATSPSVRALVQVLEKKCVGSPTKVPAASDKVQKSPCLPPIPRPVRVNDSESPVSKDEGYSTMSSDVQVDSASSLSSFMASGSTCSSPATLRRTGSSCGHPATRSLPMNKRKTLTIDPSRQPNRSISLQETHSGAALEDVKEVVDETDESCKSNLLHENVGSVTHSVIEEENRSQAPSAVESTQQPPESGRFRKIPLQLQFSWPEPQLGNTLYDDWSPSSAGTEVHFESLADASPVPKRSSKRDAKDPNRWSCDSGSLGVPGKLHKWTSDSELYKNQQEIEANWTHTLQLQSHVAKNATAAAETHPLRRTKAQSRLGSATASRENSPNTFELTKVEESLVRGYSAQEMEDWILRSSSEELIHRSFIRTDHEESEGEEETEKLAAVSLPSIKEMSFELDDENMFSTRCNSTSSSSSSTRGCSPAPSMCGSKEDLIALETEFTRDFYRLVKFESNRSLANSEKLDTEDADVTLPDRQTALKSVLDFIAQQHKYCQEREVADEKQTRSLTPELPHPNELGTAAQAHPTLHELRKLVAADPDDSSLADESDVDDDALHEEEGLSTSWMPLRASSSETDLTDPMVRASMLNCLMVSSSSSCCTTPDSPAYTGHPSTSLRAFHLAEEDEDDDADNSRGIMREEVTML